MVGLDLVTRVTRRPVDSRLHGNDGEGCGNDRWRDPAPLDCGSSPQ